MRGGCGTSGFGWHLDGTGCGGVDRDLSHGGDDGQFDGVGPLLPDVTPSGPMMANSPFLPIFSDTGAPTLGYQVVLAVELGGIVRLGWPLMGVPVLLLLSQVVRLLFLGLA